MWRLLLLLRLSGEISDGDFRYLVITLGFLVRSLEEEEAVKTSSSPNMGKNQLNFVFAVHIRRRIDERF